MPKGYGRTCGVRTFENVIRPEIAKGEKILIAAHGNSIRALRKHLEGIWNEEIAGMNVPTGVPLVSII